MLSEVHQCLSGRRSTVFTIAATVGSTVFALTAYNLWRQRCEKREDEELFGDITVSPLFSTDVSFPKRDSKAGFNGDGSFLNSNLLSIAEREKALKLARDLLRQTSMADYAEESSNRESSDSEGTSVSLNYHIATEMEKEERESLVQAVVQGELLEMEARGKGLMLSDYANVLVRVVAYLDISNEREKLRERRSALYINQTREGALLRGGDADQDDCIEVQRKAIDAAYDGFFRRTAEIDRRLRDPNEDEREERFEMEWDGDDDGDGIDEADLMAYLDQDDAAGYGNRMEARIGTMLEHELQLMDAGGDMYGEEEEEEEDEEEDDVGYDLEKAEFERMLLNKLHQLAASLGQGLETPIGAVTDSSGRDRWRLSAPTGGKPKETSEGGRGDDEWETESDLDEEKGVTLDP